MSIPNSSSITNHQVKTVEIVYDTERIKVLIDETRKEILSVLSEGIDRDGRIYRDMTVAEIAERLRTNPQRLYHHIDKLLEYNFIQKTREERKKRSITSYYSRTAQAFLVSYTNEKLLYEVDSLVENFTSNFLGLLNVELSEEETQQFEQYIAGLTSLSSEIFSDYSQESEDADNLTNKVEHLYFLLEYFLFYTHSDARKILAKLTSLIEPKIQPKGKNSKPKVI